VHDRLSVAFVTGEHDVNRKENEASLAPMFADLGIHSKLWVVPRMGHDLPPADVHSEVYAWLADDLKRRREDAKAHPGLAVAADEAPTPDTVASRWVEEAEAELKKAGHVWRGVALLRSVVERWPNTDAGDKGRRLLRDVVNDDAKARRSSRRAARTSATSSRRRRRPWSASTTSGGRCRHGDCWRRATPRRRRARRPPRKRSA